MCLKVKKIRIGFIGAGKIAAERHLPELKKMPEVELVAVCNRTAQSSALVAQQWQFKRVDHLWEDLVLAKDLDVIWICTPPYLHSQISIAALNQGKHVFCQARMAMDLSQAKEMFDCAEKHPSQVTMVCPAPNALKDGKYIQQILNSDELGQLYHFRLESFMDSWADASAPSHWRQRKDLCGNNILSVGIYGEVLNSWFGEAISVFSTAKVWIQQRKQDVIEVPDFVQVLGEWGKGLLGSMEWSGLARFAQGDILTLYGSKGTLRYDFGKKLLEIGKEGDSQMKPVDVPSDFQGGWFVEKDFIRAVKTGYFSPEPSFAAGFKYMIFLEAINKSFQSGQRVFLKDLKG